jgi:diguanylate cyclase (GGDEF)-like protein
VRKIGKALWLALGLLGVLIIGLVDYCTGPEIAFSLFYLIPVSIVAWYSGRFEGILISFLSAVAWLMADIFSGRVYSSPIIGYWNAFSRLGFFLIVTWLLSVLKNTLRREQELSRRDPMTGAANSRYFHELAQAEISRAKRYDHPFTIAYLDVDNFKAVNDTFGHKIGDQVLLAVVHSLKNHLRSTDIIGRLGGDEFACLLVETDQGAARIVMSKLFKHLTEDMSKHHWPITFSVGVLTCNIMPSTVDEIIHIADELMYSVKKRGKNNIIFSYYSG